MATDAEAGPRLSELLRTAAARLAQGGVDDPPREASRIWADLTGTSPGDTRRESDRPVAGEVLERFRSAIVRRAAGEPLPYVTGLAGFRMLTLRADRRALIPRPETEGLVELVLAQAPTGRVVDVGTGSGCIALALAQEGRYDSVVAVDRSAEALALARENRQLTGIGIELVRADLLDGFAPGAFDVIVSNPPYLTALEYESLDAAVHDWEPRAALPSGEDGLNATRRLILEAAGQLRHGGLLALEVDASRAEEVAALGRTPGWTGVTVHHDLFGRARYVLARRSEFS
ncbi:MAG: peptide chain release factor N(5)-glutamine methyltransferase [Gemmatimonadales bacterium]